MSVPARRRQVAYGREIPSSASAGVKFSGELRQSSLKFHFILPHGQRESLAAHRACTPTGSEKALGLALAAGACSRINLPVQLFYLVDLNIA